MSNTFISLEPAALDSVTGGTGRAPSATKSGPASSSNDQILSSLTGLQDSLKDLAKPQTNNNSNMLMLCMAMAMSRPAAPAGVVVVGRRGYW